MNFFLYRLLLGSLTISRPRQLSTSRVSMSWHSPPFSNSCSFIQLFSCIFEFNRTQPEKTADMSWRHHCFPREVTSEKRALKFHTDDASLPRSGLCSSFWLILPRGKFASTNQATVYGEEKKKRNLLSSIPFFFHRLHWWILRMRRW